MNSEINTQYGKGRKRTIALLMILLSGLSLPLVAQGPNQAKTIPMDPEVVFMIRVVLGVSLVLLLIAVLFFVATLRKGFMLPIHAGGPNPDGRDEKAGFREFYGILTTGCIAAGVVLVSTWNPLAPPPKSLAALNAAPAPVEDWTELTADKLVLLTDAESIAAGKKKYEATCAMCHGNAGEGVSAPNLSDNFWIHGGTVADIYKTITEGVPAKGMLAWKEKITPKNRLELTSFILSLQGTNPPNAKAPEGTELKADAAPADSAKTK